MGEKRLGEAHGDFRGISEVSAQGELQANVEPYATKGG
jgi:hypothetical protein